MNFNDKELAILNHMITIALLSGEIEHDKISKSVHKKVTEEICRRSNQCTNKQ